MLVIKASNMSMCLRNCVMKALFRKTEETFE